MEIQKGKVYLTRDGELIRVYATDGQRKYPVHGAVYSKEAEAWLVDQWTKEGRAYNDAVVHGNDIVSEAPEENNNDQIPLFGDGAVLT